MLVPESRLARVPFIASDLGPSLIGSSSQFRRRLGSLLSALKLALPPAKALVPGPQRFLSFFQLLLAAADLRLPSRELFLFGLLRMHVCTISMKSPKTLASSSSMSVTMARAIHVAAESQ